MRVHFIGLIGNFFEHYDHALFGFLAPFLAPFFFPAISPLQALIYTYAMLSLGVVSSPLGALVFGKFGDRIGRKKTLAITLFGMALTTTTMGFLPLGKGGIFIPIAWSALRFFQSFFAAGEKTGGALFILEKVPQKKRCLWSSLFDASGILGTLAAATAVALASFYQISWSWLFWAGAITGLVGAIIRLKAKETWILPKETEKTVSLLWKYKNSIAKIASVSGFSYANYYLLATFMNGFLPLISPISKTEAMSMNALLLAGDFFLLPLFGMLGSKIGKEKLMFSACICAIGCAVPLFGLATGANYASAIFIRMSLTCIGVALAAPYHAWALEQAPLDHRYLICAIGSSIGTRVLGAPAPALAFWLYQQTGWVEMAALPIVCTALLASFVLRPRKNLPEMANL